MKRIEGLDGLRFYAFLIIIINHVFDYLSYFELSFTKSKVLNFLGLYSVQYFFAGSGFLITYMFFVEEKLSGKFNLRNFYARRITRIWPAYYVLVLLVIIVFNFDFFSFPTNNVINDNYSEFSWVLYLCFLPHLCSLTTLNSHPLLHHTYTISIEEQFYLIWALIFKFFRKHFAVILIFLFIMGVLLQIVVFFYRQELDKLHLHFIIQISFYIDYTYLTSFALSSGLAFLFFYKQSESKFISWLYKPLGQIIFYVFFCLIILLRLEPPILQKEFSAFVMCILLLQTANKKTSLINWYGSKITFLGMISYSIYLFHTVAIFVVIKFFTLFTKVESGNNQYLTFILILSVLLSLLFGILSFNTIEKISIKWKNRYNFKRLPNS